MKRFTFNNIKEFCRAHYVEYIREAETGIVFSFSGQHFTIKKSFLELATGTGADLSGVWKYVGHDMFGDNKYMFKFKRIA